jgi:signal transduction histidine kinase
MGLATGSHSRVAVAVDAASVSAELTGVRNAFLLAVPPVLLLIGWGSWILSSRALRPLRKLTAATVRISAERLDERMSVLGGDREFVELIEVFNGMLERLKQSFGQARRFSSDAAHELQTPLAILQGQLERAIPAAEEGSPLQGELTSMLDEARRLSTITKKLLLLSQADAGRMNLHREPFALSEVLAELLEDTRMLAPHLDVSGKIEPGLTVSADGPLLVQALQNLVSNAIKYNVDRGWIRISAVRAAMQVEVRVVNSSSGIPAAERERIFDRFYRTAAARSQHIEGAGLGLSVSREIARAHGGDLVLHADSAGAVQFSLLLPADMSSSL